jgi:hypothetical protein
MAHPQVGVAARVTPRVAAAMVEVVATTATAMTPKLRPIVPPTKLPSRQPSKSTAWPKHLLLQPPRPVATPPVAYLQVHSPKIQIQFKSSHRPVSVNNLPPASSTIVSQTWPRQPRCLTPPFTAPPLQQKPWIQTLLSILQQVRAYHQT